MLASLRAKSKGRKYDTILARKVDALRRRDVNEGGDEVGAAFQDKMSYAPTCLLAHITSVNVAVLMPLAANVNVAPPSIRYLEFSALRGLFDSKALAERSHITVIILIKLVPGVKLHHPFQRYTSCACGKRA